MNDAASTLRSPRRSRGMAGGVRGILRMLATLAVICGLWLGASGSAHATAGRPTGWSVEQATGTLQVGRMVFYYEPALAEQARTMAEYAPYWWSEIETELAGDVDDTVTITFVDHSGRVAEASGMPHWAAGVAHPPSGEIIIARHAPDGSPTNLEELLRHEMAHVVLYRATGGAALPRWFHEGVAESFNGTLSFGRAQTLAAAVFGPGVPDLEHLEQNFRGTDGPEVSVAYAASRDLVDFLRGYESSAGSPAGMKLRQVFTELRQGHRFEIAFIRAYDRGLEELVGEWRAGLPGRFIWYPLAASGGLPFILVAPLVGVAWIRRRRAVRRGMHRLELEDARRFERAPIHTVTAAEAAAC